MPDAFDKAITGIEKAIDNIIEDTVHEVGKGVLGALVSPPPEGTPVDTGLAKSNWVGSKGSPVTSITGSRTKVSFSAQRAGLRELTSWKIADRNSWITNNLSYIKKLNAGHSRQTPPGFVERAVQKGVVAGKNKLPNIINQRDPK